jgi:hypothetical protein
MALRMFKNIFSQKIVTLLFLLILGVSIFGPIKRVLAAALTTLSDTQSSLRVSTLSDHTIQFVTPTGIAAGQGIAVTFPSGYATGTFNVNNFDFATSTSAACSGFTNALLGAAPATLTWGVSVATSTVYITSGTAVVPANRCVQIRIGSNAISQASGTSVITNPAAAGPYSISIAGSFGDNGSITQNIITNDTVSVSATVQQSITFTISTTTIYFGTLGIGGAKFASSTNPNGDTIETIAHTLGIATNAPSGYNVSLRGQTLTNQQATSSTINAMGPTAASSTIGTEQFGIRASVAGGTGGTVDATYSAATSYGFDATATTSASLAVGNVSTNTTTYSLRYVANIAGTTEAGTYVADLVYVATANF